MAPRYLRSASSSTDASFVTANLKYGLDGPATPPELAKEPGRSEPSVAEELEEHATDGVEDLDDLAGIASAILSFTEDLKQLEETNFVPYFTIDSHSLQTSPPSLQQPLPPPPTLPISSLPLVRLPSISSESEAAEPEPCRGPFQKWMRNLHHRANERSRRFRGARSDSQRGLFPDNDPDNFCTDRIRTKSSSGSSFAFVAAVKSASIGPASISTRTTSRLETAPSREHSRTDRSSRLSIQAPRFSEDSAIDSELAPSTDPAAIGRSLRRRRILEELITTEEDYIGDIRFLMNVSQAKDTVICF